MDVIPFPRVQTLDAASLTDKGRVREGNEDSHVCQPRRGIFLVADGIGGHPGGEVASALAAQHAYASLKHPDDGFKRLATAFSRAHDEVRAEARRQPKLFRMGTTLTALLFDGDKAFIGHAGDSRAYMLRDRKLCPLTRDDSFAGQLTNSIGVELKVDVSVGCFAPLPGDVYLLCTDGLTNMVEEDTITGILNAPGTPEEHCQRLVAEALEAGGLDNVTVIVVKVPKPLPPVS